MTYSVPSLAILGFNLVTITQPVAVPPPKSSRVVYTNSVNALNLKSGSLEPVDKEAERRGSIGTRENVFVHEKTPCEILVLPRLAKTGNLKEESTVIIQHVIYLPEEAPKVTDADMLGHFKASYLLVAAFGDGNVTIVHAQDLALLLGDAGVAEGTIAPGSLVAAKSDTGSLGAKVDAGEAGESAPTAANVEQSLSLLKVNLLADNGELVILELFQSLLLVDVRDDTGGIYHARAKEPAVEVIAAVIVIANLLLI